MIIDILIAVLLAVLIFRLGCGFLVERDFAKGKFDRLFKISDTVLNVAFWIGLVALELITLYRIFGG